MHPRHRTPVTDGFGLQVMGLQLWRSLALMPWITGGEYRRLESSRFHLAQVDGWVGGEQGAKRSALSVAAGSQSPQKGFGRSSDGCRRGHPRYRGRNGALEHAAARKINTGPAAAG